MNPRIIVCPFCHLEIPPGQPLCSKCGTLFCPQCRNPVPKTSGLCPICGFLYMPEQPKGAAPSTKSDDQIKPRTSIPKPPRLKPQPYMQAAVPSSSHIPNSSMEQHICPQCGTNMAKAYDICPGCGLLFNSRYREMQQHDKIYKPQSTGPSTTPTSRNPQPARSSAISRSQSFTSQTKLEAKSEQETLETSAPEEKEVVTQALSTTALETVETPDAEKHEPVKQSISETSPEKGDTPVTEQREPVLQTPGMAPPETSEISAPKGKQILMAPPKMSEISAPKAHDLFPQSDVEMSPEALETFAPDEKNPIIQVLSTTPPETAERPAADTREPEKYQRVITAGGWQLPSVTILDKPTEVAINQSDIEKRAQLIEEAINSYGVEAKVVQINIGPTVTQFGVEPGWDRKYKKIRERDTDGNIKTRLEEVSKTRVKVDRISALANDLALALAAPSIRIEAPVPGKPVVGIEVPNTNFDMVNLRSVIESTTFQKVRAKSNLTLALGKGAGGETVAADLDKMPHLLIAGATGSGKTACLNSIICCLLIHNTPDDTRFIMIDPKRVELVSFNSLPHLAAPVVVDTDKAILALRWLNQEMDNRYNKFAQVGVRNIDSYNKNWQHGEIMPYIVVVIDELADLMMAAYDEVEHTLCRLAQLARATGIHLIVATQRPSVDVVTGLIKANFPTRISFALTSQVDSRTILDSAGAEKLLGKGDMLYLPTDASKPKRLQGTFATDAEIERIVHFWNNQRRPEVTPIRFEETSQFVSAEKGDADTLLEDARQLAKEHENISTSFLQRRLRIGYPRAARIMEQLEEEGYKGESAR